MASSDVVVGGRDHDGLRPRLVAWAAVAVLALLGALLVRGGVGERGPAQLELTGLDGTALAGDSYLRLNLELRARGADAVGAVSIRLRGREQLGLLLTAADETGRARAVVDIAPRCRPGELAGSTIEAQLVRDGRTVTRSVTLPLEGTVERLVAYQCQRDQAGSAN